MKVVDTGELLKYLTFHTLDYFRRFGLLQFQWFNFQMDTIVLPPTVSFKMEECKLYFGGVPPDFDTRAFENLQFGHLVTK